MTGHDAHDGHGHLYDPAFLTANCSDQESCAVGMSWALAVAFAIEVPLLGFHLTVLACVTRCIFKKTQVAASAFFKIYIVKSLVDYLSYALGSAFFRANMAGVSFDFISGQLMMMTVQFLLSFSLFFQTAADTMISATRYTAIVHPMSYDKMFAGARLKLLLVAMVVVPSIAAIAFVVLSFIPFLENILHFPVALVISTGFPLGNALLSAFMAFRALHVYLQMTHLRKKASYEDYRLLVFAIFNLVTHIIWAICNVSDYLASDEIAQFVRMNMPNLVSFIAFSGPFFLLWTSKPIRLAYGGMICGCFMRNAAKETRARLFKTRLTGIPSQSSS